MIIVTGYFPGHGEDLGTRTRIERWTASRIGSQARTPPSFADAGGARGSRGHSGTGARAPAGLLQPPDSEFVDTILERFSQSVRPWA